VDPTFTIVIPAFNRERYIAKAIDSALAQTLPANEIIVVDDGSTDRTAEIASRYPAPVKVIRIENSGSGPSHPKNVGILTARSNYIMLLDSDDQLEPMVLEKHRQIFAKWTQVGLVCNNWISAKEIDGILSDWKYNHAFIVETLPKTEILPATYLISSEVAYEAMCTSGDYIRTPGTSFPKQVWSEVGGFDETFRTAEDYDFFIRTISKHDIVFIDKPLETIIFHDGNISSANLQYRFSPDCFGNNTIRLLKRELSCNNNQRISDGIKRHLQRIYFGLAYHYRNSKHYLSAVSAYNQYLYYGGNYCKYASAMVKLIFHRCLSILRFV
jgi:glycosyltransferase involved in cell wall biosynthesis